MLKQPAPPESYPGLDGLPPEINKRKYAEPVKWLLGWQLINSLKGTLLYTAFGSKADARGWMTAEEFPEPAQEKVREKAEMEWMKLADKHSTETPDKFWMQKGEFWFDYLSDTGDGMKATYSIAYLCMSDLWVKGSLKSPPQSLPATPSDVGFMACPDIAPAEPDEYQNRYLNRYADKGADGERLNPETELVLPRGAFLLVGGDTAYHLSDYGGLNKRFKTPFAWAFHDLINDGRLWKAGGRTWDELRRPLFGIPGNHDYYDMLDGFRRQFHHPMKDEKKPPDPNRPYEAPQLTIPGFFRYQHSSYVALRLPFDWLLWGLDTELGKINERQRKFFRRLCRRDPSDPTGKRVIPPDKLIVATPAPTTVFGKYADIDDEKATRAFLQLGLPRPFLPEDKLEPEERDLVTIEPEGEVRLPPEQIRLDLSGDIHLYARYWGPDSGKLPRAVGERRKAKVEEEADRKKTSENYASVVSGLGGAFHHPSTNYAGEIGEQVLYPSEEKSRREVARQLFSPLKMLRSGGVGVIGFLVAFLIYYSATVARSSRQAVDNFPPFVWAGIGSETEIEPVVVMGERPRSEVRRSWPWSWRYGETWSSGAPASGQFTPFWGKRRIPPPEEYRWGVFLAFASLILIGLALYLTERLYKKYNKNEDKWTDAPPAGAINDEAGQSTPGGGGVKRDGKEAPKSPGWRDIVLAAFGKFNAEPQTELWFKLLMVQFQWWAWLPVLLSALALWASVFAFLPYRDFLTPFGNSMMVLLSLVWAVAAIVIGNRYSDWLAKMTSKITIKRWHWILVIFLSLMTALSILCGFAAFGLNNTASGLLVDILLLFVVALTVLGLTVLGGKKIWEVSDGWKGTLLALPGAAIGFFHGLVHIAVPFLLVRKGTCWAWLAAAVLMPLMQFLGWLLMRWRWHLLPWLWLAYGILMLLLPYAAFYISPPPPEAKMGVPFPESFRDYPGFVAGWLSQCRWLDAGDYRVMAACLIAGLFGLALSCIWLGWYFAVALFFNGHYNEAGGAARIERFKQFIRFRLTENDLTGFIIAVDDPERSGRDLKPKIIDVFRLKVKNKAT